MAAGQGRGLRVEELQRGELVREERKEGGVRREREGGREGGRERGRAEEGLCCV